ncbi:MAG: MoaD/ThiS family protein [Zestosphaera sp.]
MRIKFFGIFRDLAGVETINVELPSPLSVSELLYILPKEISWFNEFLKTVEKVGVSIIVLVNDRVVSSDYLVKDDDEVTLLPPAAGG